MTFLDHVGDVPALVADNDLTGYSATISVVEELKGNQLGGTFALELDGFVTDDLAYDVSAEELEEALEDLGNVGTVDVTRYAFYLGFDFYACSSLSTYTTVLIRPTNTYTLNQRCQCHGVEEKSVWCCGLNMYM